MARSEQVRNTEAEVARRLAEIAKLFTPDCKLVFVMHKPGEPGCYMVVGDEPVEDAAAVLWLARKGGAAR